KSRPFTTIKVMRFHDDKSTELIVPGEFRRLFRGLPVDRFYTEWAHGWAGEFAEAAAKECKFPVRQPACRKPCHILWKGFAIAWNGIAYACCNDLRGEYALGDIAAQPLDEIWNGEPMLRLRRAAVEERFGDISLCEHCTVMTGDYNFRRFFTGAAALAAKAIFWYESRR
ncbi:MAG: SPASM domain-containing protein, partial [bacterium]